MLGQHRWMLGIATSTSVLGLAVTGSLIFLANRLVDEFSHPHEILSADEFKLIQPLPVPEPPLTYQRPLMLQASDGTLLRADFWAQPRPAPTVVFCHGYRSSRADMRPGAAVQYSLGYNVLVFDFRGHGASDSIITSGGYDEARDLEAAIIAASLQPETLPNAIILHGFSMGAAIALLTEPRKEVAAIIADSPFARSDEMVRRLIHLRLDMRSISWKPFFRRLRIVFPAVAWMSVATSILIFRMRFGHTYVIRPDASFERRVSRRRKEGPERPHLIPVLLIHASGDQLIPFEHAQRLVARAQAHQFPLETYFVDCPAHCGAYAFDPERYVTVIQDFLVRHLRDALPGHGS
jgi:fermentation-respiration switch protein FrsA (DUF1100 family)